MIRKNAPRHLARRVNSVATINGGTTEYIAGCLDPLNHAHTIEDGPLFLTIDSTVSINAAGEVRKKDDEVGYWPFIVKTVIDGKETRLLRDDGLYLDEGANAWPKRWVLPMYRIGPSNNAMTRSTEQH
ncbi:MAG: hypothetical protein HC898_12105 [Phycisphaerales bacterium]|nr:hypothetical protein [Phycisphaerales bacterium]